MTSGLKSPSSHYLNLVTDFPPRPIKNDTDLLATQTRINNLLDQQSLNEDEQDYLRVLGMLVFEYEENYAQLPHLEDGDFLETLMEEYNLSSQDLLDIFVNEETILAILQRKRSLHTQEIQQLRSRYY